MKSKAFFICMIFVLILSACGSNKTDVSSDEKEEDVKNTDKKTKKDDDKEDKKEENTKQSKVEKFDMYVINVNKADCILLCIDDKKYLVDTATGDDEEEKNIDELFSKLKIEELDGVFITHTHKDHIGGLKKMIKRVNVKEVLSPKISILDEGENKVEKITSKKDVKHTFLYANDKINIKDGLYFEVLGPIDYDGEEENNNSLVLKLSINGIKILLAGDMEKEEEKTLLEKGLDLSADILKVAHHGRDDSCSKEFLEAVSPKEAIISTNKETDPETASKKVLDKLANSKKYITQEAKLAIHVSIDKDGKYKVERE